jgi:F0F1-type ATP synthase epsilon subunit
MIEEKTDSAKALETAKEEHQEVQSSKPTMHVKVYSPFKTYFNDQADSISGQNATGPFDILPKHHNFMTLLQPCELVIRTFRGEEKIRISGGLMHVKADQVTVFLDI